MQVYGLKSCDTCRKALKALPDTQFVDVRKDGVPAEIVNLAEARFGDALINRRSTTWRGLDDATRDRPTMELLVSHPALMKRPLIVDGDAMYLGWDGSVRAALGV